ncbi:MAG: hypothetical protein ACOY33_06535 [Pseudomonadota bacterium]
MNDGVVNRILSDVPRRLTLLELRDGSCLAVGAELVRYARSAQALEDPLGNGVRGVMAVPAALQPDWRDEGGHVEEQHGGAVLLRGGSVLLIKPYSIELYASSLDALHGRDCRGRIDLERR